MLTFYTNCKLCKKKLDLCTTILIFLVFFFFAVKCTEISMRVIVPLWELGVGIIKVQNDSFVLFALPRDQVARKSRLLSFMLEIGLCGLLQALIAGYFGTVHFSSNCILQQKNVFWTPLSCLWYSIRLPCLHFWIPTGHFHVQPGIKRYIYESSGSSFSLSLGLQPLWAVHLRPLEHSG